MKIFLIKLFSLISCLWLRYRNKVIFIYYYNGVKNVGDQLTQGLISFYTNKSAVMPPFVRYFEHYLIVGSIIEKACSKSTVLGSGTNSEKKLSQIKDIKEVKALRGHITQNLLSKQLNIVFDVPLGDFALLYPRIYNPKVNICYSFGIVLHYVDFSNEIADLIEFHGGLVISVNQDPKGFIDMLLSCRKIISSSMHGIILSDAYEIPNKRIILSNGIIGADLKFSDYYSTTNTPNKKGLKIIDNTQYSYYEEALLLCSISDYIYDLNKLEILLKEI